MRKTLLTAVLCLLCIGEAWSWGREGHAIVAQIAENHLSEKARQAVNLIMKNKSITQYASYADVYRDDKFLQVDYGMKFTNGYKRFGGHPHTFEVNMKFEPFQGFNDNGRYVKNCLYFIDKYAKELESYETEEDTLRFRALVMVVHFMGDIHCPEHIRYNPKEMSTGHFNVLYKNDSVRFHTFWDRNCVEDFFPQDFKEAANIFDNWPTNKIQKTVKGTLDDWATDAAKCSYPVHRTKSGDVLTKKWLNKQKKTTQSQLTKAGYRLAEMLNRVFDKK